MPSVEIYRRMLEVFLPARAKLDTRCRHHKTRFYRYTQRESTSRKSLKFMPAFAGIIHHGSQSLYRRYVRRCFRRHNAHQPLCEFSRQIVSFAKQLGEQYSGLGFAACCCKGGNSACFTCCELPLYFGELLLQPTASTLSSVSISLYFASSSSAFSRSSSTARWRRCSSALSVTSRCNVMVASVRSRCAHCNFQDESAS